MSKYNHRSGCSCASCQKIRSFRRSTGNSNWDHRSGCGCSRCRQIENLREQAELSARIRESKRTGTRSRSSGGCFLTTAACDYKGLPDDCYELETLRNFRDSYLLQIDAGRNLVANYYEIAPQIVDRLKMAEEFESIWAAVLKTVKAIEDGNVDGAIQIYKDMVLALQTTAGR